MKAAFPRLRLIIPLLLVGGTALLAAGPTNAASRPRGLVVYSAVTAVQYINNADDEARGMVNNPFSVEANDLRPKLTWKGDGPFAGDVTVYNFNLYTGASLKRNAGSASFTCYYNYNEHAFCEAYYEFNGSTGTVLASGPVNFNDTGFTLIVTGGTDKEIAARGEVEETAAAKHAQRVSFMFIN